MLVVQRWPIQERSCLHGTYILVRRTNNKWINKKIEQYDFRDETSWRQMSGITEYRMISHMSGQERTFSRSDDWAAASIRVFPFPLKPIIWFPLFYLPLAKKNCLRTNLHFILSSILYLPPAQELIDVTNMLKQNSLYLFLQFWKGKKNLNIPMFLFTHSWDSSYHHLKFFSIILQNIGKIFLMNAFGTKK